jgi:hypothetical protein
LTTFLPWFVRVFTKGVVSAGYVALYFLNVPLDEPD